MEAANRARNRLNRVRRAEAGDALRTDAAFASGQITVPLEPGVYRLVLIVKDIGSERTGTEDTSVKVPTFEELAANR